MIQSHLKPLKKRLTPEQEYRRLRGLKEDKQENKRYKRKIE